MCRLDKMTSNSPSKSYKRKRKTGRQAGREAGKKEGRDEGEGREGEKRVGRKKKANCKFSNNFCMAFDMFLLQTRTVTVCMVVRVWALLQVLDLSLLNSRPANQLHMLHSFNKYVLICNTLCLSLAVGG